MSTKYSYIVQHGSFVEKCTVYIKLWVLRRQLLGKLGNLTAVLPYQLGKRFTLGIVFVEELFYIAVIHIKRHGPLSLQTAARGMKN